MEKKYIIKYSSSFIKQFNSILYYFVHNLKNKDAAEKFYNIVTTEIERRSINPKGFEKYLGSKNRKTVYYRIYVKNYTIFYVVIDNTMEVRRIIYSKRNFEKLI